MNKVTLYKSATPLKVIKDLMLVIKKSHSEMNGMHVVYKFYYGNIPNSA